MNLFELLNVLSPNLKLVIEYDNDEVFISGYTAQYVKDQAKFFETLGDDTYKRLQVLKVDYLEEALYVYCISIPYLHKLNNTIF